jgi:hypothetical protein
MKTLLMFISLVLFTIPVCAEPPEGVNIPLTARDPFKVKNFHDVVDDLSKIKAFIDKTGVRLQESEIAVFFSAANSDSVLIKVGLNNEKLCVVRSSNLDSVKEDFRIWSTTIRKNDAKTYVEAGQWIALNKIFDRQEAQCNCAPNIQIYIISHQGIGIIEHSIKNSVIDKFLNATSVLMSEKLNTHKDHKSQLLISESIDALRKIFNSSNKEKILLKPFKFLKLGSETSEVGETQETYEIKIR